MEHRIPILLSFLLLVITCSDSQLFSIMDELHGTLVYIIGVERHEQHELLSDVDLESFHLSFLPNSTLDSGAARLLYSYRHVLSGFAARLTPRELETIKSKPGFHFAQRNRYYPLATTYTPKCLGLTSSNAWGSTMTGTLSHSAPWVLTVGASTTDRRITSIVELGNGMKFHGESAYHPKTWNSTIMWPLEFPGKNGDGNSSCCVPSALTNLNLKGKIVICFGCAVSNEERGKAAYNVGAEGLIVMNVPNQGHTTSSFAQVLPATNVAYSAAI